MAATERWTYFLIPLPDPVGLENGRVFRMWEHIEPIIDGAFGKKEDRIIASICIHQIDSEIHEMNSAYDYFNLAEKVWPSTPETEKKSMQEPFYGLAFTRTVAEVAVAPLDDAWRNHLNLDEKEDLYHQFEIALSSVNSLLEEYRLVAKLPVRLATLELLPPFIPQAFSDLKVGSVRAPENFSHSMYLLSPHKIFVPEKFTEEQAARLASNLELSAQPHPLRRYASVRNDAFLAQYAHGDQRMAVILIATSCEILINSVLQSVMWETDKALKSAAKDFHRSVSISKRIEKFVNYFSASWDLKTVPELIRWDEDIARLRNQVVHSGNHPTKEEVDRAWAAMDGLLEILKKNLEDRVQKYPRTLSWLVADKLHDLSLEAARVVIDARNKNEPSWVNLLDNWSKAIMTRNERPSPELPIGPPRVVIYTDFSTGWIAADAGKNYGCFVDHACVIELFSGFAQMMQESIKKLEIAQPDGLPEPLVLAIEGAKISDSFEPDWVPIHEIDPMVSYSLVKNKTMQPPPSSTVMFS